MADDDVTLELFTDPRDFLAVAGDHLAEDPVTRTVVTTVTARMARARDAGEPVVDRGYEQWWAAVRDASGAVVGTAMRTAPFPPYPLFVQEMPEAGARELARVLHARGAVIAAANGALPAAQQLMDELALLSGGRAVIEEHTRLFELGELTPPSTLPAGSLRLARPAEAELCLGWFRAFHVEAAEQAGRTSDPTVGESFGIEDLLERITEERIWVWVDEHDVPVHVTGANLPSYGVTRIGPVYTPREHRGHGLASAAVAEVSRSYVEAGVRVCLFTDQANPVSNAIYQRLGYRPVVDMANLRLEP
ncbi:GNAT family N-acetyltransferase [Nocardioides sp. Root151]|uniref:GNAT family N-acetyltransferase n=1 Tax=Nocardioides sp. Root151 TaxID=1736475 RepID=UPI000703A2B0|nr:GNAT family N-acetyltransferase [Nocardioides sp. Root151]KQZ67561.1 hypothetical protein ASD66_21815 [Nocardioides sp. Root151]